MALLASPLSKSSLEMSHVLLRSSSNDLFVVLHSVSPLIRSSQATTAAYSMTSGPFITRTTSEIPSWSLRGCDIRGRPREWCLSTSSSASVPLALYLYR
ncbi:hypothetical protein LshimejAT787_1105610 [Lyophyllum shimeji]|uniref:Uncharacterized protein n=1 Tax=Lyophyllum shimeji TaxID=47721 RepID=A0A9P3PVR1_LYOSH|nr:hypothetical protein LshimejAT787_1105610 [Lyophyllum shimeji]